MKMCSLCRLCGVAPALCPAWPGPVRLTPSNPRNYRIAESPNRRGARFDRIANREALPRDSARFDQTWTRHATPWSRRASTATPLSRLPPGPGLQPSSPVRNAARPCEFPFLGAGAFTARRLRLRSRRLAATRAQPPGRRRARRRRPRRPSGRPGGPARRRKSPSAVSRPSAGKLAGARWGVRREVMPRRSGPGRGGGGADPAAAVRQSSLRPSAAAAEAAAGVAAVPKARDLPSRLPAMEVLLLFLMWSLEDMLA